MALKLGLPRHPIWHPYHEMYGERHPPTSPDGGKHYELRCFVVRFLLLAHTHGLPFAPSHRVSARAEVDAQARDSAELEIDAGNDDADLSIHLVASAGNDFKIRSVEATKGFDADGGRVTVTPRFNLEDDSRDVVATYSKDKTNIKLTASTDSQELTFSQQIDDDNRVAPTLNSNGDISVEWERRLGDDSSLTATLKPNDSLDVEWKDSAWTANVKMPIDGANINGANVSIKRDVNF
jgi:hypothetical protein